jgi:hypothetical protein
MAVALVWLIAVGIGTACFFPPGTSFPPGNDSDWASLSNAHVFGSSMAMASAFASSLAFAMAGKPRRTVEVVFAVSLTVALLTAVAYTCLWLDPSLARSRIGHWELERLRQSMILWSASIVRYEIPLGAIVGLVGGALAGLLAILARRRPRLAMGLTLGLLLAGTSRPVQQFAFGLVLFCGQGVRFLIQSPGLTDPYVPASGATMGAIAGAIIAAVVIRSDRSRPASEEMPFSRI